METGLSLILLVLFQLDAPISLPPPHLNPLPLAGGED
jgi:hypothetical protein